MKNFRKYIYITVAASLLLSCNDAIDIKQDGEVTDQEVIKTAADVDRFLVGSVYGAADLSSPIKFSSIFTDEVKVGPANAGQDISTFRYIMNPADPFAEGIWGSQYLLINRANQLLDKAKLVTPVTPTDIAIYNNALGEARALRAFAYITLMSYYTPDMADDNALGVILADKIYPFDTQLPRAKNSEIWSFVESDLNFAYNNVDGSHNFISATQTKSYFVDKDVINAMRARMYVYRKKFAQAKQYAQEAINLSGLSLTPATPIPTGTPGWTGAWATAFYSQSATPSPYRKMLYDDIVGENIFKLSRPSVGGTGGNIANMWTTNQTNITGSPWWTTGINLYNKYNSMSNDIRKWAFVDPSSNATTQVYVIDKYPGKNTTPLRNDLKVFRISEMYLILAECAAQEGDFASAGNFVKMVRDARKYSGTNVVPAYANKVAALKDIMLERRIELAFEGHRYVDLRRMRSETGESIDRNAADDFNSSTPLTISLTDHRWTLPIPLSERNGNPGIVQNTGY